MRPKPSRECRRCGKRSYPARRQAERVAEDIAATRGSQTRVYECPYGEGWHLTKQPDRFAKGA